jgi:lysophospholipase L1-like esterase
MLNFKTLCAAVLSVFVASSAMAGSSGGSSTTNKMIIGDSIFALSGDIKKYLESDLKETLRSTAKSGCQVLGGNLLCTSTYNIPNQWKNSTKTGIKTIIMNGGGNDFLLGSGKNCLTSTCIQGVLNDIEQALAKVYADMKAKGMTKIVYLGYYNTPSDANNVAINTTSMNYKLANYSRLGVTLVDTRPSFAGKESSYIGSDGIHPTAAGSRVLATLIKNVL